MILLLLGGTASLALAAPPTASVTSVLFSDLDLDRNQLGGTVSWTAPGDTSQILNYNVYLATDAIGGGRVSVGTVAVGTNQVGLSADTALGSFTYVVVMTANVDGEQANAPGSILIEDQVAVISGLFFNDEDLDPNHIGGRVAWNLRGTAPVTGYRIYIAEDANGLNRALLGDATIQEFNIPADTLFSTRSYVCVYPVSSLGESSQPSAVQFYDVESPVRNLAFQDLDLDAGELGGQISWQAPVDVGEVTQYVLTRSTNSAGAGRGSLGTATAGATSYTMSANTAVGTYTHISVYSRSSLAEASTPVSVSTSDVAASVSGVTFTDTDQDAAELGGTVSWTAPANTGYVAGYSLYMATNVWGASRSNRIGVDTLGLSRTLNANTNKGSYTHFTVYTRSSFTEQSTPAALAIVDAFTSTTYCNTFTCPAADFNRGAGILCTTGVCDAATCCRPGCRGTPSFFGVGFAAAPSSCTDMSAGSSCTMQCASGYSLWCPSGGTSCNTFTCRASGGAYLHQAAECVRRTVGNWGTCSVGCGSGTQTRSVVCSSSSSGACASLAAVTSTRSCSRSCSWLQGSWGTCSQYCGVLGVQTRSVACSGGTATCHGAGSAPPAQRACRVDICGCHDDGRHDPMRPWGRNHSMSCDTQWWVILWVIISSCLVLLCCLSCLLYVNKKQSTPGSSKTSTDGETEVRV